MTESVYSLSLVRYVQADREIVCVFSNGLDQKSKRFAFFPSLITDAHSEELFSRLSSKITRSLRVLDSKKNCRSILGSDFGLLEKISAFIAERLHKKSLLLPAERQFLLSQNWGFFDSFEFRENQPVRLNETVLPETNLGFLSEPLEKTLSDFLRTGETETANRLIELVWWSNFLKVPIPKLPSDSAGREKIVSENLLFLSGLVVPDATKSYAPSFSKLDLPLRLFEKTTEFDFGNATALLCTKPYYNLGLETLNCDCCKPLSAASPGLLPHSLVKARILQDGFFFESFFRDFAFQFHHSNQNKASRKERQAEFGFSCPSIGPFEQGQIAEVPLADAVELEKNSQAVIAGLGSVLAWTCRLHESALSVQLSDFSLRIASLERSLSKNQNSAVQSNGLKGFVELEQKPRFVFQKQGLAFWNNRFVQWPSDLLDFKKPLADLELALALSHVRSLSLSKFALFNERLGNRTLRSLDESRAFVGRVSGVSLADRFSKEENHPLPMVADWHFWSVS